jgi:hypothetical protein
MSEVIEFPTKRAKATDYIVGMCIKENKSLIIGTSYPQFTLQMLQAKWPEAMFRLHELGVELCSKK